ncbi:MAG: hypothetical protein IPO36_03160 [Anaerolineales bacterium]|nr:hypothetical protein [Anaerolineales bacterium]
MRRFYPELEKNKATILDNLTREEVRFARTVEAGTAHLQNHLDDIRASNKTSLDGHIAFDLYATYGLPFEISRDIAREQGLDIDEAGFTTAKEVHAKASGGGKAMGKLGGEDSEYFANIFKDLQSKNKLGAAGVEYDPYNSPRVEGEVLALVVNGESVSSASLDDVVEVILPKTGFYIESGGQVNDEGYIRGNDWEIEVTSVPPRRGWNHRPHRTGHLWSAKSGRQSRRRSGHRPPPQHHAQSHRHASAAQGAA